MRLNKVKVSIFDLLNKNPLKAKQIHKALEPYYFKTEIDRAIIELWNFEYIVIDENSIIYKTSDYNKIFKKKFKRKKEVRFDIAGSSILMSEMKNLHLINFIRINLKLNPINPRRNSGWVSRQGST